MSVTPCPDPDRFDPVNQMELNRIIHAAFGPEGIDDFENEGGRIYSVERPRPLVCALMEEALTGGWLGTTQWEMSEKLTKIKDRAWVSRARHEGRISLELFLRVWLHPGRPKNSMVTEEHLRPLMDRSAAIGIGRRIAKRLPASYQLVPEFLTELNYELGCAVVDSASAWSTVCRQGSVAGAIEIIRSICGNGKDVIPEWYTDIRRCQATSELIRLTSDGPTAFNRLADLSRRWRGVLIATAGVMECIWSREGRDAA